MSGFNVQALFDEAGINASEQVENVVPPETVDQQQSNGEEVIQQNDVDSQDQGDTTGNDVTQTEPESTWEQRYKALQGKYNAEVPRMQEELKALRNDLSSSTQSEAQVRLLTAEIDRLKAQIAEVNKEPEKSPLEKLGITEDQIDQFGDAAPVLKAMANRIADLESRKPELPDMSGVQNDIAAVKRAEFTRAIRGAVGDAETLTTMPEWNVFVNKPVPFGGGKTFNDMLYDADARNDAGTVIEVFNTFREQNKPVQQKPQQNLGNLQQPGRVSASGVVSSGAKKYPADYLQQQMRAAIDGKITWAEFQQLEAEFMKSVNPT